tara:strand:+ start:149 stop:550 length:402 start_codon:yes stop_codon:yes gene_type:complete
MQHQIRPIISHRDEWDELNDRQKWNEYMHVMGLHRDFRKKSGSPSIRGKMDPIGRAHRNQGTKWSATGNAIAALFVQFPWSTFLWVPLLGARTVAALNAEGWMDNVAAFAQGVLATMFTFWIGHSAKKNYSAE